MGVSVPLAARVSTLNALVNHVLAGDAKLHLLGSALTLTDATTLANCHAAEATWAGYAAQTLLGWTAPSDPSGPIASTQCFATFVPSGSSGTVPVYGYYITDGSSVNLYAVFVFPSGPTNITRGQPYTPLVQYNLLSQ